MMVHGKELQQWVYRLWTVKVQWSSRNKEPNETTSCGISLCPCICWHVLAYGSLTILLLHARHLHLFNRERSFCKVKQQAANLPLECCIEYLKKVRQVTTVTSVSQLPNILGGIFWESQGFLVALRCHWEGKDLSPMPCCYNCKKKKYKKQQEKNKPSTWINNLSVHTDRRFQFTVLPGIAKHKHPATVIHT